MQYEVIIILNQPGARLSVRISDTEMAGMLVTLEDC